MVEEKKHFLHCIELINKASKESIDVLRSEPMSNMNLIDRASKYLKDPNPLSTTMALMSLKYPLSIDREKAIACSLPRQYYLMNNRESEYTHYHGRILCKKEVIEWWINEAEEPGEDTIKVIDILMSQHRKEVSSYYNINWRNVRIQWGTPNLERRRVSTRIISINIDPSIKEQALMQELMPDYITPYKTVTESDLKEIRELSKLSIEGKMSLSTQIRILLNQMDPKRRVLPVLTGSSEITASLKHSLTHSNFVLINFETDEMRQRPISNRILESFGKNLQYEFVYRDVTQDKMLSILNTSTCMGKPVINYIRNPDIPETNYIKWMKVIAGQRINSESESHDLKTSPVPAKIRVRPVENTKGMRFLIYEERETVNFKYKDIRGSFVHDGPTILKRTTNFTTYGELVEGIIEIYVYCRWGMRGTTSRNYNAENEIRDIVYMQPYLPLNCTPVEINSLLHQKPPLGTCGALTLVSDSEYRPCPFENPEIDRNGNISSRVTNQTIHFPKFTDMPAPIPV